MSTLSLCICSHSDACLRASSRWPAISSCCIWPAACCRSPKPGRGCSTSDDTPWADPPNPADPPDQGSLEGGAAAVGWVCAGARSAARRASANKSQSNPVTAEWYHQLRNNDMAGTAKKGVVTEYCGGIHYVWPPQLVLLP